MYKNQLQELAQRSCFNLPSYACKREGPDHAPRFKASVTFNGEIFEGPSNCTTLRQAEHAAAKVALLNLSSRFPSKTLTARVLDETGVYKNLLQESAHRAGLKLPVYTTVRSGPGHQPVFSCSVELAGFSFNGEPAKTKKQAEKNAALAAWSALKQMPNLEVLAQQQKEGDSTERQKRLLHQRIQNKWRSLDPLPNSSSSSSSTPSKYSLQCDLAPHCRALPFQQAHTITRPMHRIAYHRPGVAPAVHVRSVIPVCAAPPMKPPLPPPPPASNATANKEKEDELSLASTKFSKLQL